MSTKSIEVLSLSDLFLNVDKNDNSHRDILVTGTLYGEVRIRMDEKEYRLPVCSDGGKYLKVDKEEMTKVRKYQESKDLPEIVYKRINELLEGKDFVYTELIPSTIWVSQLPVPVMFDITVELNNAEKPQNQQPADRKQYKHSRS